MKINDRIFTYPVLNYNKTLSNYGEIQFKFSYERVVTEDSFILKDAKIETDSNLIKNLLLEGKIDIYCIIECSYTVYRKAFKISNIPSDIELINNNFSGEVSVSIYAVATQDFILNSDEFEEDFRNINFEIEKYNILAANDGFIFNFLHEEKADDLKQSIFSIFINHDMEPGSSYVVECENRKIEISLSEKEYNNYRFVYQNNYYQDIFFNMLLVPALNQGLMECQNFLNKEEDRDFDDVSNKYPWFNTIKSAYKKLNNIDLKEDDLKNKPTIELAQDLLGKPFGKALTKMIEISNGTSDEEDK